MEKQPNSPLKRSKSKQLQTTNIQQGQIYQSHFKKIKHNQTYQNSQRNQKSQIFKDDNQGDQELQCLICTLPYNLNRKIPVLACKNRHTFCLHCIVQSIQLLKTNCPICRGDVSPQERNQEIYQKILKKYQQRNTHQHNVHIRDNPIKLSINKFGKKHSDIQHFEFVPRVGKIIKKNHGLEASLLIFDNQLKQKLVQSFRFTYFPSKKVQISFGICIYDKFLCKVVKNCGFDTKIFQFFMKKKQNWLKIDSKKGMQVILVVDLQKNEINWFTQKQNKETKDNKHSLYLMSSQPIQIDKQVGDLSYYPFCAVYNNGDMIQLNK